MPSSQIKVRALRERGAERERVREREREGGGGGSGMTNLASVL